MARLRTHGSAPHLNRRDLLKLSAAVGTLFIASPMCMLDSVLRGEADQAASRTSVLVPDRRLVHADLHNHSLLSDGTGDPAMAFQSMREAGLDVAALTDHTESQYVPGIDEDTWRRMQRLADEANVEGQFVAMRGFEWTEPSIGHINVWFSEHWIDTLHTADTFMAGATLNADKRAPASQAVMQQFYEWLQAPQSPGPFGGGGDGLAGFNHPGTEPGLFNAFEYDCQVSDHLVSIEVFNQGDDYLFPQGSETASSPINEALNRGWRVGLLGVSDHHGSRWGREDGLGRAGLWVTSLTRDGVHEALTSRRFFASLLNGVRFAATANGVPMGGMLNHRRGPIRFEIDVSRGPAWRGKRLSLQLLTPGKVFPQILTSQPFTVPETEGETVTVTVDVDADAARWVLVRLSDPTRTADRRATGQYASLGGAVVYSSPFWLEPA
jgi:hypothetical protein